MTDNEFMLYDRVEKIKTTIEKYGEENFSISFSGGKDSTVLSWLVDYALPGNSIPRVYADTGIDYNLVREFVYGLAENDKRIEIIKPSKPIKQTLDAVGYPFKSKTHSFFVDVYQRRGKLTGVQEYLGEIPVQRGKNKGTYKYGQYRCPQKLEYQFTPDGLNFPVSRKCCVEMKEKPLDNWNAKNGYTITMTGVRRAEAGSRRSANCLSFRGGELRYFQPLAPCTDDFVNWLVETYDIELSSIYYPPFNFKRTGCKGCPFDLQLQKDLDTMQLYFPNEYKQSLRLWEPVYTEYIKINYRLKRDLYNGGE